MKKVAVRNGAKRRGKTTTTKRRRNAATAVSTTKRAANGTRKRAATTTRRKRRNGVIPAGMMLVPTKANGAKRKRKGSRRNGITRRNGVLDNLGGVAKQVALGGLGAVITGVAGNAVAGVVTPFTDKVGFVPRYMVKGGIEVAVALVPLKYGAEKLMSRDNVDAVVAGGVIKGAISIVSGLVPSAFDFNPLTNAQNLMSDGGGIYDLDEPYEETSDLAGVYNDGYESAIYDEGY